MNLGLRDRVALVCGASRGLGRAVADELAAEGATVAICARTRGTLELAAAEIEREHGTRVLAIAADLAVRGEPTRVVEACLDELGRLDVLVTNTGGPPPGSFDELTLDDWEGATSLLIGSAVELIAAALPAMRARRWGRILAITSIAAKEPIDKLMLSNSLRPAVTGLTNALAREVAQDGITVNALLPGFTATERIAQLAQAAHHSVSQASEPRRRLEDDIPIGRLAQPHEFAALAAFLASERASYITGAAFAVDGGWLRAV